MVSQHNQQLLNQIQIYQQQLQTILAQKENLKLQSLEIEKALNELEKTEEKNAYKIAGPVLVKTPVETLKKELNEKKETLEVRLKSVEKTEKMVNDKIEELRQKLLKAGKDQEYGG